MAKQEHLDLLLKGVNFWNTYRKQTTFNPDFDDIKIFDVFKDAGKLHDKDRINLSRYNLSGASFRRSDLAFTDFKEAMLVDAILVEANLVEVNFTFANLTGVNMRRAIAHNASFNNAKLMNADMRRVDFKGSIIVSANLSEANLIGADFEGVNLQQTNFVKANLERADLSAADLQGVDFKSCNLTETEFYCSRISETNFTNAICEGLRLKSVSRTNDRFRRDITDVSLAIGLTQDQINVMDGDSGTVLPINIEMPEHWPDWQSIVGMPYSKQSASTQANETDIASTGDKPQEEDVKISALAVKRNLRIIQLSIATIRHELSEFAKTVARDNVMDSFQKKKIACFLDRQNQEMNALEAKLTNFNPEEATTLNGRVMAWISGFATEYRDAVVEMVERKKLAKTAAVSTMFLSVYSLLVSFGTPVPAATNLAAGAMGYFLGKASSEKTFQKLSEQLKDELSEQ